MKKFYFVHPGAKIAKNVEIGPFTTIHDDVEIDEGTIIYSNVTIMSGARIGKNCKIFPGAVISAIPQDLKYNGEYTITEIGDNTTIRECVTINKGTKDKYKTVVGKNCLLMAYVHVAHDCVIGNNCILANSVNLAGHIIVEDYAIIGGLSAVHQFVHIGAHSMIGGGSLVRKDVPPYVKASNEPLSYIGVNTIGLRRRNFPENIIREIENVYRYIYLKGYNTSQAIELIQKELPESKELKEIVNFINKSERGIIKGPIET